MADQSATGIPTDPYDQLKLIRNPDGTITRIPQVPDAPATGDALSSDVLSKDIPLNVANNTFVRIYRPRDATKGSNLPLIVYFHGGGFILFSAISVQFHDLCVRMARDFNAVIISVDYRLAPEHRLPAAYEDAIDSIMWVKNQASNGEPWLRDYVDFSKCFLMGSSAGANMVYQAALRLEESESDLKPVKISGMILNQPFFGGVQRTESELRKMDDQIVPLPSTDLMWELSLPSGADRNHEYCNPMLKGLSESEIRALKRQRWLVCYGGEDPLMDRQKEFMKMLEESGVELVVHCEEKGFHAMEVIEPDKVKGLFDCIRDFVNSPSSE
ncbi:probable carboxylesterase 8 [Macadamia integrifolia]|uniref:probable carboxylesterase 8 n=1 Tax=Macadamia integrifolia TaxID=60698 RepID=UPI001C4F987B|nr:probable carboxylesterase 8 [Macadamia integrifolia]